MQGTLLLRKPPAGSSLSDTCSLPPQIRVKCNEDDTVGDLKKLVAAQTGREERGGSAACSSACQASRECRLLQGREA